MERSLGGNRPTKRARTAYRATTSNMEDAVIDDMDDIYDEPSADTTRKDQPMSGTAEHSAGVAANGAEDPAHVNQEEAPQPGISLPAIPGLSSQASMTNQTHPPSIDTLGTHVAKDSNPASGTQLQITHDTDADMSAAPTTIAHAPAKKSSQEPDKTMGDSEPTDDLLAAIDADLPKPKIDPEFLEAAKANKSNEEAEWQFDSSDAESSNSSSDTSSEEDSDEEGYEKMDPATLAKMLMAEEGGGEGEDGEPKAGGNSQPRTKNEQPEEVIPKPDVTVTSGMKITALGKVENVVDNYVLIKAFTSGEYQVLESGSVLCLENRSVVGAVLETIGRVQEPFYSVAFTNAAEVAEAGVAKGTVVYYVDAHSTFVFTEPLKNMKGTDASNLHDEEVGEDEMEFSDDEAEAAYKRAKKEAKRGGRGGANAIAKGRSDMPAQQGGQGYTGGAINYDDESGDDELYTPLARPSNLQEMMANGVSSVETRHQRPMFDRGRGRGGRGRGDRGRSGDRNRGGRGGRGGNDNSRRGPSHSFPDRHNANNGTWTQMFSVEGNTNS